jgi:hypothetical protein
VGGIYPHHSNDMGVGECGGGGVMGLLQSVISVSELRVRRSNESTSEYDLKNTENETNILLYIFRIRTWSGQSILRISLLKIRVRTSSGGLQSPNLETFKSPGIDSKELTSQPM